MKFPMRLKEAQDALELLIRAYASADPRVGLSIKWEYIDEVMEHADKAIPGYYEHCVEEMVEEEEGPSEEEDPRRKRAMASIRDRYGTHLRIYDNGGKTFDRYTIVPPRWAGEDYKVHGSWACIGSSEDPFHPQGFGQHTVCLPGPHLGKRIHWNQLPEKVQRFARQCFPEFV